MTIRLVRGLGLLGLGLTLCWTFPARAQDSTRVGAQQGATLSGGSAEHEAASGFQFFGDFYPSSGPTVQVQDEDDPLALPRSRSQQSIFTGFRIYYPIWRKVPAFVPAVYGMVDFGVAFAGPEPGVGDGGFALGAGVEGRWLLPRVGDAVMPFARFKWDFKLAQFSQNSTGTLFGNSASVAAGVHLVRVIDLHVMIGGSYAGRVATGVGVGIGRLF